MAQSNKIITFTLLSLYTNFFCIATKFATVSGITTNETDLEALLDIKNHIQNDPLQILNSWNDSSHFCNWQGITCDGQRSQRVTALNISELQLVGTLSPFIGNLTFLEDINLNDNFFHGLIPPEIDRLSRLQFLRFANNSLQDQFPANITSCKSLRVINLTGNKLSGTIPDNLSELPNLYALALYGNKLSGFIPRSLGNISTLETLSLTDNNLSGNIPHELGKLFKLKFLGLALNKLSGSFPVEIYNISSLQTLAISYNFLTGQFPDTLGLTLPNINLFLVANNNFSGSIPSTLANASGLVQIDIGSNKLTGPIPRNLGRLQYLQDLLLDDNPLGTNRANDISFISTLANCTNLDLLGLSGIEIGGELPPEISNLPTSLSHLWLNDNQISGSLPEGVGDLVGLTYFNARRNSLSGSIPLSIGRLINLVELYLSENNFTGDIPQSIGDISGLENLWLNQNRLTGNIPVSMRKFTKLQELNLGQNNLSGSLTKDVFSITTLTQGLVLAQNKFTGSIPSEVGSLKSLTILDVSENELSGEIPLSIGGCEMMEKLRLEGNFLNGTIPSSLGQLKSIQVIDLSRNKLSGQIPASLENLTFISTLNLSFNMIEGEVPRNGVFVNASVLSIVGNEKLCGGIESLKLPVCRKHTKKLSTHIIIVLAICIPLALVSLFGCIYAILRNRSSRRVPYSTPAYEKEFLKISYSDVHTSTKGFASENLIGDGKYGSVYRGVLKPSGKVVAVKVLKLQLKGANKSFLAECEALRSIRHRNLVKIITSCSCSDSKGNDFKALILEYVPNGSLEKWLHHQNPSKKLDLLERLNIAIDIASALDYLHNQYGTPIIHCDIKPSNVLLGNDLQAMVSDFGLAKFLPAAKDKSHDNKENNSSAGIRGTIGYVAPEYGMGGDVSAKGDIYSYGILLLEMFTGKRPTQFREDYSLHNYVKTALPHHVAEIIDPWLLMIEDNEDTSRIESCCLSILRIGVLCSAQMQNRRMGIHDALAQLQDVRSEL